MTKTYIISDLHLGHKNIIKYESEYRPFNSIEEHNEAIIERHNSTVGKNDTCWMLGDIAFGAKALTLLSRFNGNLKLVLGNHDVQPLSEYQKYFSKIYGCASLSGFILTHVPVHISQFNRYRGNIHGHLHSRDVMEDVQGLGRQDDNRYINVSCEKNNLTPINLQTIIDSYREINNENNSDFG